MAKHKTPPSLETIDTVEGPITFRLTDPGAGEESLAVPATEADALKFGALARDAENQLRGFAAALHHLGPLIPRGAKFGDVRQPGRLRRLRTKAATDERTAKTERLRPGIVAAFAAGRTRGWVVREHARLRAAGKEWISESTIRRIYQEWKPPR
jgi:hypothetical protein